MSRTEALYVVLADVVGSRNIPDRIAFDRKMEAAVTELNNRYAAFLVLPLRAWKGLDEIATVTNSSKVLYGLADDLNQMLAPDQIRLAVAQGSLDIIPGDGDVTQADGPAFHKAAAMMNELKKEGLLFAAETGSVALDLQLKLNINLLLLLKEGWTARQRTIYEAYRNQPNQEAIAKSLEVTQQSVSKSLKAIKAVQVLGLENSLQQWLDTKQ